MDSLILTTKIQVYTVDECDDIIKNLINQAKAATKNAYAPYSGFSVGAAVLLQSGKIITGTNQENAAYPSGLCAERTALFHANSQYPDDRVEAIAIAACHDNDFSEDICSPCGSCRQVMNEVENRFDHPIRIIMYGKHKIYEVRSIKELLPLSFGKESME